MSGTTLSWNEMRDRACAFVVEWKGETSERAEAQSFWTDWFNIFGLKRRGNVAYEYAARRASTGGRGRIDAFWPKNLAIEHKSEGESLKAAVDQAFDYLDSVPQSDWPRYVMSSDFADFLILDLDTREYTEFALDELPERLEMFGWIAGYERRAFAEESEVNVKAAELMGRLYDLLAESGYGGHDLNVLLVRLLFILFADDTGVWEHNRFTDYLLNRTAEDGHDLGMRLYLLFEILDTPNSRRQAALDEDLERFPYIDGDLFEEPIHVPAFNTRDAPTAHRRRGVRLVGHLARRLRLHVPVSHGRRPAPQPGRPLHPRAQHPQGHRTAVPGRAARRAGQSRQQPRRSAGSTTSSRGSPSSTPPAVAATSSSSPIASCGAWSSICCANSAT